MSFGSFENFYSHHLSFSVLTSNDGMEKSVRLVSCIFGEVRYFLQDLSVKKLSARVKLMTLDTCCILFICFLAGTRRYYVSLIQRKVILYKFELVVERQIVEIILQVFKC